MTPDPHRYVFGRFELDVARGELKRDGVAVKLAPQPFTALQLLVRRAGDLVTREELRAALWPDDSFVDFNAGLNFCMGQLRSALEDSAGDSRVIVTVPRRGYRFVAAVTVRDGTRMFVPSRAWATAAAAVLLMAIGAAWWFQSRPTDPVLRRSLKALQKYERGVAGLGDAGPSELLARVKYFEEALAGDAVWPEAWAGLAEAKLIIGNYRVEARQIAYASAKAAAAKALALDDGLASAHWAYGAAVLYFDWDWRDAGTHLRRAVILAPKSARAHYWYSRYLSARGDHERSLSHAQIAVSLTPASPSLHTQLGMANFYAGRFREARIACDEAAALMPEFLPARTCAAASDIESGTESADFWTARLERLTRDRSEQDRLDSSLAIAGTLVHAGNRNGALDVLEQAANQRLDTLIFAAVHPALRPLSGVPRYQRILQRVGLK